MAGGISAATLEAIAIAPAALETWTKSAAQVRDWAATAQAGDTFVYARERHLSRNSEGAAAVRSLCGAGFATAYQKPAGGGISEYVVHRLKPRRGSVGRDPQRPASTMDGDMVRLLRVLRACVQADKPEPCPANRELAKRANLGNADRASYVLKKLIAIEAIAVEIVNKATGERVVTIVATGARTAVPQ
jgi:hypothetical protein